MASSVRIRGIAGSLRSQSYNRSLLEEALHLLPDGASLEMVEIGSLPLYDQDQEAAPPASVGLFRRSLREADAFLIATPEYNYSVPGVLKNAIDWASRAPETLAKKPLAIIGASSGNFGTVRAQLHLRQIAVSADMRPLNKPELLIQRAHEKFDADGRLLDETTREILREILEKLVAETRIQHIGRDAVLTESR